MFVNDKTRFYFHQYVKKLLGMINYELRKIRELFKADKLSFNDLIAFYSIKFPLKMKTKNDA